MRDHLLVHINGRAVRVQGDDAFVTLAEFLRRRQGLTGTKIVCAEGDCGACAVLVGRYSSKDAKISYTSVNSCIQVMFQLDAAHVVTVEGLKYGDKLNPMQQAMVNLHGTQCGFCTPGFVVSLCDLAQCGALSAKDVRRGLVGNLCRCTGYDSIVRAATSVNPAEMKSLDELYPPAKMIEEISAAVGDDVYIAIGDREFFKPANVESALRFRKENPDCLIVSGATDLGVQRNKGMRKLVQVMSLGTLAELAGIEEVDGALVIGAAATLTELEEMAASALPELSRSLAYFGSPLIKNAGTLAGNLVNASPIGDTIPAFFALGGEVEIASAKSRRWEKIEDFYVGYRQTTLKSDELVTRLRLPIPREREIFRIYKVSRRKDLDISSFGAAIWMRTAGERIDQIRIAYGGVGPTVVRLPGAEAFLSGKMVSREIFAEAGQIAAGEVCPISDVRGAEAYRKTLARNILVKFCQDIDQDGAGEPMPQPAPIAGVQA